MTAFPLNGIVQAEYAYNQLGQQIIRRLTQTGVTIHSVYGPDGNRIAEYSEATGALVRQYVWLQGAPVAVIEGGVIHFIRSDHIGRPAFATNSSATVTWRVSYLPFGGVRTTVGTPPTARFPGQWFQSETGLHQNWMRDYDPTTGRYLQADPLGLVDGASVYAYARQNPARFVDPRGEFGVGGAAIGAGVSIGLQFGVNFFLGGMNPWQAIKCINLLPVFNAAALGGFGFSPIAIARSGGGLGNAGAALGLGTHLNRASPDFYIGGNECGECDLPKLPSWVDALRNILL